MNERLVNTRNRPLFDDPSSTPFPGIALDLNNILAAIQMLAELLRMTPCGEEEKLLSVIEGSVKRGADSAGWVGGG